MPRLLQRLARTTRCLGQRPSRDEFQGINQDSFQAKGLMAWWPFWETGSMPMAMDYGPLGLHFVPSTNVWKVSDPMMGSCWFNDRTIATSTGSGRAYARRYAASTVEGPVDPVDFGNLPSTGALTTGQAYMSTAWFKSGTSAVDYFAGDTPPDMYIYSFDRLDGIDYPGHTMGLVMDGGNNVTPPFNRPGGRGTIYDNSVNNDFFGVVHIQMANDDRWHLLCGLYVPPATGSRGQQWIFLDGDIGFIGGQDDGLANTQPFGHSITQNCLGSPQDATNPSNTTAGGTMWPAGTVWQVVGADDDTFSSPFQGYIGDHRLYAWPLPPSKDDGTGSILEHARALAKSLYHPESRWELYIPPPARKSYFLPAGQAVTATAFWALDDGGATCVPVGGGW